VCASRTQRKCDRHQKKRSHQPPKLKENMCTRKMGKFCVATYRVCVVHISSHHETVDLQSICLQHPDDREIKGKTTRLNAGEILLKVIQHSHAVRRKFPYITHMIDSCDMLARPCSLGAFLECLDLCQASSIWGCRISARWWCVSVPRACHVNCVNARNSCVCMCVLCECKKQDCQVICTYSLPRTPHHQRLDMGDSSLCPL
jgi:hypothetical protein